ncbi:DUF4302 domain-containing protein [Riemerella anatipestifer]|uniref:DUF4302 domain-containing protein n=1 Tax=Riemerella anatipestifer TaxID=34085 RepID=UPI0021F8E4CF|nr:DUF4302 domain-containing protein [Riemerella anatipestifer]MCW0519418.1 DUF4302 domain-containing protein [Riemerella anatipestifer]
MKNTIIVFVSLFLLVGACRDKDETIFKETPSQRTQEPIAALRNELVSAKEGWWFTYFPDVDSLRFSDPNKNIKTSDNAIVFLERQFGQGGYTFYMKFNEKGTVEMLSDTDYNAANTLKTSDFEVKQSSYTQLSFTTYNYIHQLNKSDFLFWKKDREGNLIFRTNRYLDTNREYLVMKKAILNGKQASDRMNLMYQNKINYERLYNPILTIKDSEGGVLFQSNLPYKKQDVKNRYQAFVKNWQPNLYNSSYYSGVASGYVATQEGLFFYPGIQLTDQTKFRVFTKEGEAYKSVVNGYEALITIK